MRRDVYQEITDTIVTQLEQGVRPWHRPWRAANMEGRVMLPLRHNGEAYRGINTISLWMQGIAKGYTAPRWMTFKQALDLGGCVRNGEKGTLTVYADSIKGSETDAQTGEETTAEIHYMKGYTVFNVEQIDGLPETYYDRPAPGGEALPRIERAETFFTATGASIRHGGNRAFYSPSSDHIQMPPFEAFESPEAYYATLAHEASHWTKHEKRLARDFGRKRWGDEGYAMEELVAELGAAFLCATLELSPVIRDEHASYLACWLKVLKEDKRAIFSAAGHAQRAADYLRSLQPQAAAAAA
ncbi:MAG: ssDNA-binding domain-containing protein [Xanthobacteraceae bacterium]|nr:ssDNA-binding domain-containing protein [Xanthobacteraceae bacterium]